MLASNSISSLWGVISLLPISSYLIARLLLYILYHVLLVKYNKNMASIMVYFNILSWMSSFVKCGFGYYYSILVHFPFFWISLIISPFYSLIFWNFFKFILSLFYVTCKHIISFWRVIFPLPFIFSFSEGNFSSPNYFIPHFHIICNGISSFCHFFVCNRFHYLSYFSHYLTPFRLFINFPSSFTNELICISVHYTVTLHIFD